MKTNLLLLTLLLSAQSAQSAVKPLKVVTTTEDLAAIARDVGGTAVEVQAIAKGYQDPHFVEAKPSHLLKIRRADLFIQVGLEMEVAWAPALLANSRNPKVLEGAKGFLDVSEHCEVLQKPEGKVDRSMGDVHPHGNPHYWTDPENGRAIARAIAARLRELDPPNAQVYVDGLARFEHRLDDKMKEWLAIASGFRGAKVVTYHNSWPNFAKRFGLEVVDFVEPRPGVPPSPRHVQHLIGRIRQEGIRLILMETYWDAKVPQRIAADSGAALVSFPASVGAKPQIQDYFDLFDHNLGELKRALGKE